METGEQLIEGLWYNMLCVCLKGKRCVCLKGKRLIEGLWYNMLCVCLKGKRCVCLKGKRLIEGLWYNMICVCLRGKRCVCLKGKRLIEAKSMVQHDMCLSKRKNSNISNVINSGQLSKSTAHLSHLYRSYNNVHIFHLSPLIKLCQQRWHMHSAFLKILKRMLQNFKKLLKNCFHNNTYLVACLTNSNLQLYYNCVTRRD